MARYIDADLLIKNIVKIEDLRTLSTKTIGEAISNTPTADVVEVRHGKWESFEIPHMMRCSECGVSDLDIHRTKFVFCPYCGARMDGTPKEIGADKPKTTCLNCKHLMFSDMYGECNKQLRIVNPSDTCEYAEPKERGVDK